MNSKLRNLGSSSDKSRSGLVSPSRNDKLSPSSKVPTGTTDQLASSRTLGQKTASISVSGVTAERKQSILGSSSKGLGTFQAGQKKASNTASSSQFDLTQQANAEGAPLQQLDISGITPTDARNNNNDSIDGGVKGGSNATGAANNRGKLNITGGGQMNTSFTQQQKSPVKNQPSGTPAGQQPNKKTDTSVMPLMQSTNMGAVDVGNVSMIQQQSAQTQAQKEMETSVNFEVLKQFDQKQKSSNIKTFIRVRPLNKMEIEFNENGVGNEDLRFPDSKTVQVLPEKTNYNFDKVYPPGTEQEMIFEDVGKEMVNDVLQGYNGTIFAYGPTGSGKTFTMFGDVNDAKNKGIIPRVSNQIFTHINSVDQDIEFTITVSMLEIYKEQLFDLLKVDRVGLKIKENTQKGGGIYVQGLTAISVDCEDEILDTINLGYSSKQTRETRMNEYSSRSHTIFTINVTQRYSNGQEKIGKLNLVDLAGSEKIAKTQASGESLEEAKKINLSLSCLGNVIHALTSNQEHIPYRDSKLTRILQESLGGNYKTSLIAAISPHSSQHEEQQSTLRFAARAKTIKNVVKMNVKLSLDQMRKLIEQLKAELEKAKAQNTRFRNVIKKLREEFKANQLNLPLTKDGKVSEQHQVMQNTVKALDDILNSSEMDIEEVTSTKQVDSTGKVIDSKIFEDSELDDTTEIKPPASQFSGKRMSSLKNNYSNSYGGASDSHGRGNSVGGTSGGQQQASNLDYKNAYQEKLTQCRNLEKEVMELKRNQLEIERKLADVHEEKHRVEVNHTQQITKNNYNNFEIEIMQKQIQSLVDSICKSENTIGALMKEKQEIAQKKIEDLLKEKLSFSEIHFSEYFKNSINFNYDSLVQKWNDVQKNMKTIGIDDQELFKSQAEFSVLDNTYGQERSAKFGKHTQPVVQKQSVDELIKGSFMGDLDFNSVANPYEMLEGIVEFPDQLEKFSQKHPISRDLIIILLKKQIFNSHIINQHLARTINALEWKQIIEYGKAKMKSVLNKIQSTHISNLEQVINEASKNYRTLRNRIESVELETQFVREKMDSHNDAAPKKSKIIKDTESIRQLLLKPSNDGIRQSLRGSYIGFQLDIDKTETPLLKELKETDELVAKDLLPLTYDRAIEELKQRNSLIRKAYSELKGTNAFSGMNQELIQQVLKEKERLEGKISMLSNELKMEIGKSEHYADAYKAEKSNFQMQKEQTKELEQFLVSKMKEENEHMEQTQKNISDQHEKEILKYQTSFQRLSDKFSDYIRSSLNRLSELKKTSGQGGLQSNQVDQMIQEMLMIKEQYNKMFNPEGNAHIAESPSNTPMMGFNPSSMIFKSFDNYSAEAQHSSQFYGGEEGKQQSQFQHSSTIKMEMIDEVKETSLYANNNNSNNIENVKRASNNLQPSSVPASGGATPSNANAIGGSTATKANFSNNNNTHYKQGSTGGSYYQTSGGMSNYSGSSGSSTRGLIKYGQFGAAGTSSNYSGSVNSSSSSSTAGVKSTNTTTGKSSSSTINPSVSRNSSQGFFGQKKY